jgi:threonine/homoserine/homoserine lactone efflux protein
MSEKPKQNWPTTPLGVFGALVLAFLAFAAWDAAINTTQKSPALLEMERSNQILDRSIKELRESYK